MTATPMVSVVLPTYNRTQWLGEAIESVLAQTLADWELVIVDDGSAPATADTVRPHLSDARIHYVWKPHAGVAAARNAGLRLTRGSYAAFLDDDDCFLPDKLARQVAWMEEHRDVGLVYNQIYVVDEPMNQSRLLPRRSARTFLELFCENAIQVASVLVRRTCLEAVGGFDESLIGSEDYDLWLRIAQRFPIEYLPRPLAIYRKHGQNKSNNLVQQRLNALAIVGRYRVHQVPGLTRAVKRRRLATIHYRLARTYRAQREYWRTAQHFWRAARLDPAIGTVIEGTSVRGRTWLKQWLKPYGGIVYGVAQWVRHGAGGRR
ncbi:MAG: glycosyltransferase [Candidatus Omnitrophica bacterium]|nr:glycosyltransferase [Candidatus Omnitrophota bacterium]